MSSLGPRASLAPAPITAADYAKFCDYFYSRTGILFADNKRYFVDKRLIERMVATRSENFARYLERLAHRDAHAEIECLINLCTINETYFYREDHQLDCLAHGILPELTVGRSQRQPIRIWSMPCSTGEEPYSIAIYLLENWAKVDDYDIEIIASDIDTNVLSAAEAGIYSPRALHRLSPEVVRRYFTPAPGGEFQLIKAVRNSVRFTQVNASDAAAMRALVGIDVIFCRNMLIYFDDRSRRQAVESFYDSLVPGGFVCLGHAESMSRISALFAVRKFPQAIVYQKPKQSDAGGSK